MIERLDPLLAVLARLLVARGVLFAAFEERMKAHFVRAAETLTPDKTTASHLSVATGLQRRVVARLRGFTPNPEPPNPQSRLVAMWQTEPGYNKGGLALELPLTGDAPSFDSLAKLVRKDVHTKAMLDALLSAGTVQIQTDSGRLRLCELSYRPKVGSDEQLQYLVRNTADHLAAAMENIRNEIPPFFERAVHYSGLTQEQVEELQLEYNDRQMQLLQHINQKAAEMKRGNSPMTSPYRFRAGGYFYAQKERGE